MPRTRKPKPYPLTMRGKPTTIWFSQESDALAVAEELSTIYSAIVGRRVPKGAVAWLAMEYLRQHIEDGEVDPIHLLKDYPLDGVSVWRGVPYPEADPDVQEAVDRSLGLYGE